MALYSASQELWETVVCFFDFHEMSEKPRYTPYPVIDFLVSGQAAKSLSYKLSVEGQNQMGKIILGLVPF